MCILKMADRMSEYLSVPARLAICASSISAVSLIWVLLFNWIGCGAAGCVSCIVFLIMFKYV